uniref:Uncharacterized protein LOC117354868 n=1 Tax=Geotrypetes seraphini TaxID=260995 RepID=A0A6P8QML8_GEOSA|nr:uncharacterized protein LOC117354868 [Geotrypetes seraphini]
MSAEMEDETRGLEHLSKGVRTLYYANCANFPASFVGDLRGSQRALKPVPQPKLGNGLNTLKQLSKTVKQVAQEDLADRALLARQRQKQGTSQEPMEWEGSAPQEITELEAPEECMDIAEFGVPDAESVEPMDIRHSAARKHCGFSTQRPDMLFKQEEVWQKGSREEEKKDVNGNRESDKRSTAQGQKDRERELMEEELQEYKWRRWLERLQSRMRTRTAEVK